MSILFDSTDFVSSHSPPLVSVIVPVYNVERYLDCCLESIRSQTYDRLEIIVVEDCSTDGSLAQLQPHLADPRLRLIQHETNAGLSAARNTGIEAATGAYVMFVDSDDAIARTLVQACVAHVQETGADVVMFDFVSFRDGEPLPEVGEAVVSGQARRLQGVEYFKQQHFAWLKFMRKELLDNPHLRFAVGYCYEDWPFHWELGFTTQKIDRLPFKGCAYRLRSGSITHSSDEKLLHIFVAQQLITNVAERYAGGPEIEREVMHKIWSSTWRVLITVDGKLIERALNSWRAYYRKHPAPYPPLTLTERVTIRLARMPKVLAIPCIKAIRGLVRGRALVRGQRSVLERR